MLSVALKERFYMRAVHPALPEQRFPLGDSYIYLNGVHVGYVSNSPGAHISLITELDESTTAAIKKFVNERDGFSGMERAVTVAPALEDAEVPDDDAS